MIENGVKISDEEDNSTTRMFSLTDLGNADRFISQHGNDVMHCHDLGCWMVWQEDRWLPDGIKEVEGRAQDTVRGIHSEIMSESSPEKQAEIMKWAKQSQSGSRIREMVRMAQSNRTFSTHSTWLDKDDYVLNLVNGTLNLKTKEFYKHNRQDLLTKIAPTEYDPEAICPIWIKFLSQIFGYDKELLLWVQKAMGYALTGDTSEQCLFMLWGKGRNGKSTFLNTIKQILGDYTTQVQPETLMTRRNNDGGSPRSDLMALRGARFVTASEGERGQQLAESLIKQLTGGEVLSCRGLYQKTQVEFMPKFKLFFATNYKPQIGGTDLGISRRIRLIPFDYTVPADQVDYELSRKLMNEAPGILSWMVEGCYRWQEDGLGIPASVKEATEDYLAENDQVEKFIADCCLKNESCSVRTGDLYVVYEQWATDCEDQVLKLKAFGQALADKGFEKKRRSGGMFVVGLGLLV